MSATKWVRVRDKDTGHVYSVQPSQLQHGNYEVLEQSALDSFGVVRPPEYAGTDASSTAEQGTTLPAGEPTADWTKVQLEAYARIHDIDLTGKTLKADVLSTILAAGESSTDTQEA